MENREENKYRKPRPIFPKKAVITAGMPYGNKELHFGHVGGMFVHADTFARFLKDRIGKENVIFVSGTDCYGSPIMESFRKLKESGEVASDVSIQDYVEGNYRKQKAVLKEYEIESDYYGASALNGSGEKHKEVSEAIFNRLYENGWLTLLSTPQFYDPEYKVLLNGRQVLGRCPIEGCTSDKAYADECSLGHQYMPSELLEPVSALSGKKPEIVEVKNWYFRLEEFNDALLKRMDTLRKNSNTRKYILTTIEEFLKPPVIYVQKKQIPDLQELAGCLPAHEIVDEEKKPSVTFVFHSLSDRDAAREELVKRGIRYRTGKTLVPFRLSGNIEWGVPVPEKEGIKDLTFWVWPESLWAPVSFLRAYLAESGREEEWKEWWTGKDSKVYQFIGEDNIYFYGIAEMALFTALECPRDGEARGHSGRKVNSDKDGVSEMDGAHLPELIANRHILFMDKKASSSSEIKPPMAGELLSYYTAEQLRMHFLSLGLSNKSSGFKPQVYLPAEEREGVDPVLKDGNLLTNVFNRLVRSCLYAVQKDYDSRVVLGEVSEQIKEASNQAVIEYESQMARYEFHRITYVLDGYIRLLNKHWSNRTAGCGGTQEEQAARERQVLCDCFYGIKTALLLLHPIAPSGCEMVREYIGFGERVWNWDFAFSEVREVLDRAETKYLPPRTDFFRMHESAERGDGKQN